MEKQIKYYVEEIWIDHFVDSFSHEIKSVEDYLINTEFDPTLIGFRFFQRELRIIDGKFFSSEPENHTEWISNNYNDNVIINNEKIKLGDCISLQDFVSRINTTDDTSSIKYEKKYTKKIQ